MKVEKLNCEYFVLRDRQLGLYLRFDKYGCLSPVRIKTKAATFSRENAERLIEDGVVPRGCDYWPYMEPLDLEYVYVAELNKSQLKLPLQGGDA